MFGWVSFMFGYDSYMYVIEVIEIGGLGVLCYVD